MTALQAALPLLTELRQALGQHGELSGQEAETRRLLREFLARHTSLEVYDLSGGLVAAHREPQGPCIAFRGDMDAIPGPNGPYHGCGHDGHSALLAGLGLLLEGQRLGKSVLLLFQPAEETGQGAAPMAQALLAKERVRAIVGFHNIPGYPLGQPLLRQGVFGCCSACRASRPTPPIRRRAAIPSPCWPASWAPCRTYAARWRQRGCCFIPL